MAAMSEARANGFLPLTTPIRSDRVSLKPANHSRVEAEKGFAHFPKPVSGAELTSCGVAPELQTGVLLNA